MSTTMRELTDEELKQLRKNVCPLCGSKEGFRKGPEGGSSVNVFCHHCGAGFNLAIFIDDLVWGEVIKDPTNPSVLARLDHAKHHEGTMTTVEPRTDHRHPLWRRMLNRRFWTPKKIVTALVVAIVIAVVTPLVVHAVTQPSGTHISGANFPSSGDPIKDKIGQACRVNPTHVSFLTHYDGSAYIPGWDRYSISGPNQYVTYTFADLFSDGTVGCGPS